MNEYEHLKMAALALVEAMDSGDETKTRWARRAYDQAREVYELTR